MKSLDTIKNALKTTTEIRPLHYKRGGAAPDDDLVREMQVQPLDNHQLDSVMGGIEHQKKYGFKKGGAVNHAPSEAQKEAGNYRKKHISFQGLNIAIENEKGSIRKGKSPSGHQWRCVLPCDYGYIKGTVGADKDHVDCYVGPDKDSNVVFVVNRHNPGKGFDEHKVLLGFKTEEDALCCYVAAFSDGSGPKRIGSVATMSLDGFKSWLGLQRQKAYGLRKGGIVDRALRLTASKR